MNDITTGLRPSPGKEYVLVPHPHTQTTGLSVTARIRRDSATDISIQYRVTGDVEKIALPRPVLPHRADDLWEHTCFEAFLRLPGRMSYTEWNFSPSMEWAAYKFKSYRSEMRRALVNREPIIALSPHLGVLIVDVYIEDDLLKVVLDFNLAAVIEGKDGTKSYWALAHAPGPPDFHNPDCFIGRLPSPDSP